MEILAVVTSILAVFFAGATWWQKLRADRANREKEEIKESKERQEASRKKLIKDVSYEVKTEVREILSQYVSSEEAEKSHKDLCLDFNNTVKEIDHKIDTLINKVQETDIKNIRNMIIQFADDLRSGANRSEVSYKHALESYDYYKKVLHGNSYIDQEIDFIKEQWAKKKDD